MCFIVEMDGTKDAWLVLVTVSSSDWECKPITVQSKWWVDFCLICFSYALCIYHIYVKYYTAIEYVYLKHSTVTQLHSSLN